MGVIVTPADIRLIPERYAIGKRPLSLLLGWGELTYTRLLDGNTPNDAHAIELRRLLDDPAAYARVLEKGRARITDAAYNKSMKAVDALLADQGGALRATRVFAVADRFCELSRGDLTPSALQRLSYYAQGLCFAMLDKPLFDELPIAAAEGPSYLKIVESYPADEIAHIGLAANDGTSKSATDNILDDKELGIVDYAYELYGDYSGQALARMSRSEAPWRKARKRAGAEDGVDCAETITAKSMKKFFAKQLA